MQDRNSDNRINEEFTDFAWGEMNKILDREMPVKKNKKRFVFWWIFGVVLILGLIGGYSYLTSFSTDLESDIMPVALERTAKEKMASSDTSDPATHTATSASNEVNKATPQASNFKKTAISKQQTKKKKHNAIKVIVENSQESFKQTKTVEESIENIKPAVKDYFLQKQKQKQNEVKPLVKLKNIAPIAKLELVEAFPFQSNNAINFGKENQTQHFWKKLIPTGLTLYAGLQNQDFRTPYGYQAGFELNYQFNGRWGMNLGLEYQSLRIQERLTIVKSVDNNYEFVSLGFRDLLLDEALLPPVTNSVSSGDVFVGIDELDFINFPINVHYNIHRNWRLYGGLQISYLLDLKGSEIGFVGEENEESLSLDPLPLQGERSNGSSELAQDVLTELYKDGLSFNKWNLGSSIGFTYFPSKRLGIDFKYNLGLSDIVQEESLENNFRNSALQLSLSYKLF